MADPTLRARTAGCWGWLILAVSGAWPSVSVAQVLDLRLRDDSTGAPVIGAIVRLLDERGAVAQGLTDLAGHIVLRAPAGRYRIRADRIGFRGIETGHVALAAGETLRQDLRMPSDRVALATIEVRGKTACDSHQRGGSAAAVLWEEIKKALTANLLTQRRGVTTLFTTLYEREATPSGTVTSTRSLAARIVSGQPFVTLPPAELATRGFVSEQGDSTNYAAPDARLLLSDEFVDSHCFSAVARGDSLIGLAFEPVSGRRVADVKGTLWVDRRTNLLTALEFRYTGLEGIRGASAAGGRLEFEQLPDGAWIVTEWHIRMPIVERRLSGGARPPEDRLLGYIDRGGRATRVRP